ncbi:hypothetical protein [Occallatibacter riparius]|uniref:Uncharacterized protein n=1 Tax=Occallatibacter riparius TaxID=1002689 RepID=A0A9J7BNV0_9BACT|nr:hypothetical protein [Occallatibacter riparius]UWZ82590.1 hypothetical protein MOP44_18705 [Occallatibacter riparius]
MPHIRVEIVEFVDSGQPGWVACTFRDADAKLHRIIDKIPLFTAENLWSDSTYPQPGIIECRVLERIPSPSGNLVRISIEPYHYELTDEQSEFVINEADLHPGSGWQ